MPPKAKPPTSDGKVQPGKEGNPTANGTVAGVEQMEFSSEGNSAAVQKVRQTADKLQTACGAYAEQLAEAVQKRLRDHGVTDEILKDVKTCVGRSRGTAEIGLLLDELKAIPLEIPSSPRSDVHPGIKQLNFQDLIENAKANLDDSLEQLVAWLNQEMPIEDSVWDKLVEEKKLKQQRNCSALNVLVEGIKERLASDARRVSFEFGRGSMAWDSSGLGSGERRSPEVYIVQTQLAETQTRLVKAQEREVELSKQAKRVTALDAATALLKCKDLELYGKIAELLKEGLQHEAVHQTMQLQISELETRLTETHDDSFQEATQKIAELELQLLEADDQLHQAEASRKQLQELLDEFLRREDSSSTGRRGPLEDRLQELGLIDRLQEHLQRQGRATGSSGFCTTAPYTVTSRFVRRTATS